MSQAPHHTDYATTLGVVRLEKDGKNLTGRWGIGRQNVARVTLDPESAMPVKQEGFALLRLKVYPDLTVIGEPATDMAMIKDILAAMRHQLKDIKNEDFTTEITRATVVVTKNYNFGKTVGAVLQMNCKEDQPRFEGDEVRINFRCFHGYGLPNENGPNYGSKVKGIAGVKEGWQAVILLPTDDIGSRFMAVPATNVTFIEMVINGLENQLELATAYIAKQARVSEVAKKRAKKMIDDADIG